MLINIERPTTLSAINKTIVNIATKSSMDKDVIFQNAISDALTAMNSAIIKLVIMCVLLITNIISENLNSSTRWSLVICQYSIILVV